MNINAECSAGLRRQQDGAPPNFSAGGTGEGMCKQRVFAMVIAAVGVVGAGDVSATDVWTPSLVPASVQVTESGGFIVYFDTPVSSICGNRVHIYHNYQAVNDSGAKAMLATALAALSAEKTISVMYDDSTSFCWGRYLTIVR